MSFTSTEQVWTSQAYNSTHEALRCDTWLTEILDRPTYSVHMPADESRAYALRSALPAGSFCYTKIKATDRVRMELCQRILGFALTDTNVTLELRTDAHSRPPGRQVRIASSADESAIVDIAKTSFAYTRFHMDPRITASEANEVKAEWARNYFLGQRGDLMVVGLGQDGEPAGFCQLLHRDEAMIIDLIAVSTPARRQGLASEMIAAAHVTARERGCQWLRVGTQLVNTASLRCYEGLGFRVSSSQHIFHYHGMD